MEIFRIVHIDNLKLLSDYGITNKNSTPLESYKNIGNPDIIDARDNKTTMIGDTEIDLGYGIPFYYTSLTPMLYSIKCNVSEYLKNIIVLVLDTDDLMNEFSCYLSDGNARTNITNFADPMSVNIKDFVDFGAVNTRYWNENLEIKRKKQAEFIVMNGPIPFKFINKIICGSHLAQEIVSQFHNNVTLDERYFFKED